MVLEYGTTEFPETEKVVNPTWRQLDRSRNSVQNKLRYRRARFTEMTMHTSAQEDQTKYRKWVGTAIICLMTGPGLSPSAARPLLQNLFVTEADILPDTEKSRLAVRVHNGSRAAVDRTLEKLFKHLNNVEVKYPGTNMKLVYQIGGISNPNTGQGVN